MTESAIPRSPTLDRVGRASAATGGGVAIALWGMFTWNVGSSGSSIGTPIVALVMAGLSVLVIVAAVGRRPAVLIAASLVSLLPVGLYLLATPSIYAGVGLANLLALGGGVASWLAGREPSG